MANHPMAAAAPSPRRPGPSAPASAALAGWLAACGGAPPALPPPRAPGPPVTSIELHAPAVPPGRELGPEILLPAADAPDAEVARVGDLALRQSHAYARLFVADPKLALSAVDLLVFDVLVARHAQQHGIRVAEARVEELAAAEERRLRQDVDREFGGRLAFDDYVARLFGVALPDWRRTLRVRTAQRLYQGYVIRYLALREDRAQVRFLVHGERAVVAEAVEKVRQGADFATLAQRLSEDLSRREGGLLPPFGRGFPHPVTATAFSLQKGEVSAPFEVESGARARWFAVYCLDRLAGRDVPFAAVRQEIEAGLELHPLSPVETSAYTLRWRGQLERAGR